MNNKYYPFALLNSVFLTGICMLFSYLTLFSNHIYGQVQIKWNDPYNEQITTHSFKKWLSCDDCRTELSNDLPVFTFKQRIYQPVQNILINNPVFDSLSPEEISVVELQGSSSILTNNVIVEHVPIYIQGEAFVSISIIPLRKNPMSGKLEKLISFNPILEFDTTRTLDKGESAEYISKSQLSSGEWIRISVDEKGIHQLTYDDLVTMGLPVQGIQSKKIRVHGYGGGMLPEISGKPRYDDLPENAILVYDGGDGIFNPGDYLLFYSSGLHEWKFNENSQNFEFQPHLYSDYAYYFITVGDYDGKRIQPSQQPTEVNKQVLYYNYHEVIRDEKYNLIKSGKGWYGDIFDIVTEREYQFKQIETEPGSLIKIRFSAVAKSDYGSTFTLTAANQPFTLAISPTTSNDANTNYAHISTNRFEVEAPPMFQSVKVKFNKTLSMDIGWLNFIEVNAKARLKYTDNQLTFSILPYNEAVEFIIQGAKAHLTVWDVTDQLTPRSINSTFSSNNLHFKSMSDTIREFILAGSNNFKKPQYVEKVVNQNLHGIQTPHLVILAPEEFTDQAIRLATFHATHDNMNVSVFQPQSIYNEFSSGAQDISAIRDFMKMLWNNAQTSNLPRFLLLFGDASYDYKERVAKNTNKIPTFQSPESLHPVSSLATDDFFVSIDDNEGGLTSDMVDIGIGRIPVQTVEEATMAVDKIIHYTTNTESVNGDWRNVIAFVADDENSNVHMEQADFIANTIDTTYGIYNIDKIYLDAYRQESTSTGQFSSEANDAINQRVEKGALIINYTGHGGETGWTEEEILRVSDIHSWRNYNKLPVFVTATCEFSRYDDPLRVSAGEYTFLNPIGGSIALFTTARPTYGTPNFTLAKNFYDIALKPIDNEMPYLGDIIRIAKNRTGADNNTKKFVLLGDPAMKMAYPKYRIETTEINNTSVNAGNDTIKAFELVTISGRIVDNYNQSIKDFNGTLSTTIFDKAEEITTFASEGIPMTFNLRRNVLFKGRAAVVNGDFTFSFFVPKDITYHYGNGKISYYATNGITDATGYYNDLIIGGISDHQLNDFDGPGIKLFINDTNFIEGGYTDENPNLLAFISDSSGINTVGTGIGRDIVAILNDNTQNPFVLNDYYQTDINTYKSGTIQFPLRNLTPGLHSIKLIVWDINNNVSEYKTHFIVVPGDNFVVGSLEAWPNPMNKDIQFSIGHNQAGKELWAELSIFDLSGHRVSINNKRIFAEGYHTTILRWDGRSSDGNLLSSGFYIGNLRLRTKEGLVAEQSAKIIIAR